MGQSFTSARTTIAAILLLLGSHLCAETRVLKNFTLIDGRGGAPLKSAAVIIRDGRIEWVGAAANLKSPSDATVVDLSGKYVMPGIINLHGHLGAVVDLKQDAANETPENVERYLKTYASYGVTTVASMGTDKDFVLGIRDKQRLGRPSETRIFSAGQGFVFKGGYGGLAGVTPAVSTPAEVEPIVAGLAAHHVDMIKFWMDDHLGTQKKMPHEIGIAIIQAGHRHHIPVVAHVFYLDDAKALAQAGIDGFMHAVRDKPVDQALIDLMKKNGIWQAASTFTREASIFTYTKTPSFVDDPFFTMGVSPKVISILKSPEFHQQMIASDPEYDQFRGFLATAERNLKTMADAGIRYGMGTDSGPPARFPGWAEHWELEYMVQAGLTPAQTIVAATKSGADFLKAKDLGTLEPSKWADLIVLSKDPLADIRNTRTIESVYIAGNKVR